MIIHDQTWYTKVYLLIESCWAFARGQEHNAGKEYHIKTNLCEFMRAFLIKLPILLIMQLAFWGAPLITLIVFPMAVLGFSGYAVTILVISGIVGIGIGVSYARKNDLMPFAGNEKVEKTEPSFWDLCKLWYKTHKENWCPLIHIHLSKEDENVKTS